MKAAKMKDRRGGNVSREIVNFLGEVERRFLSDTKNKQINGFSLTDNFFQKQPASQMCQKMRPKIAKIAKISIRQKIGPTHKTRAKSMVFRWQTSFLKWPASQRCQNNAAKIAQIAKISIRQKIGPTQKTLAKSMVFR